MPPTPSNGSAEPAKRSRQRGDVARVLARLGGVHRQPVTVEELGEQVWRLAGEIESLRGVVCRLLDRLDRLEVVAGKRQGAA